jgi:hypothetical protein
LRSAALPLKTNADKERGGFFALAVSPSVFGLDQITATFFITSSSLDGFFTGSVEGIIS